MSKYCCTFAAKFGSMKKYLFLMAAIVLSVSTFSQVDKIVGRWKTVDDKTGDNFALVEIYKASNGLYYGKIVKMLVGPSDGVCDQCEGEDHNKPLEGLVIVRDMKAIEGELREGRVLDPESGKFYYGKIYLEKGRLILRGSLDKRGWFGRNQTWLRAD